MSSTIGEQLKLSIFGQSHGKAIGMVLDNIPSGLPVDLEELQNFLNRRAPGQHAYDTSRKEEDQPDFLSGIVNGYTCGAPISAVIYNRNTRSSDYDNLKDCPRPGHADYTAQVKFKGYQDAAGGGHFSGRLTAPLCIAGGLCKQWLELQGIKIAAHIAAVGDVMDDPITLDWCSPDLDLISKDFPVVNAAAGKQMKQLIADAKADSDSVGGVIECFATGIPGGLGDPMFNGIENRIAQIVFGIPAVKGLEFGNGFQSSSLRGSQNNDAFICTNDVINTKTNNAGGILGGITTGMPIVFRVAVKPTPSIAKIQQSVCLSEKVETQLQIKGRHDPCIVPRAVPVVEAAAAVAIYDAFLSFSTNTKE